MEVSYPAVYFFGGLILVLTFMSGYFMSKTSEITAVTQQSQPQQPAPQQPAAQGTQVSLDTIKGLFSKDIVKFGNGDKKLLLVEVSDPSCPYCHVASGENTEIGKQIGPQFTLTTDGGTYVPPVKEMRKLVDSGKADFAWIYTPGHGNGALATEALYCAYDQGKFWQVHDLLMSSKGYDLMNNTIKTDTSKTKDMTSFLESAVNRGQLQSCLDSGKYKARLTTDTQLASSLGVQGTPGFFLNATNFAGAYSWTDMKSVADSAM